MAEYIRDTYIRTVASGWGTADVGGAYTEVLSNATSTAGDLGTGTYRGRIAFTNLVAASGDERLAGISQRDVFVTGRFNSTAQWFNPTTGWAGTSVFLFARASGTVPLPVAYYARADVKPDGSMTLAIGRSDGAGVLTVLTSLAFKAGTATSTTYFRLELEALGALPTQLRARIYRTDSGMAIPGGSTGWIETFDETGPQAAGAVQYRVSRSTVPINNAQVTNLFDFYATDCPRPSFTYTMALPARASLDSAPSTGDFTSRTWNFGDGSAIGSGTTIVHDYTATGTFKVTLQGTCRWGSYFWYQQNVTALVLPVPPDLLPVVRIEGLGDVCDLVYSASWSLGGTHWVDQVTGSTCTISLRGIVSVAQGATVTIAAPADAGGSSGAPLWSGIVDQVTETNEIIDGRDNTMVTAMDTASQLGRYHLHPQSILPLDTLPGRLDDLAGFNWVQFRYRYGAPVYGGRWLSLKKKTQAADKLRDRTFLNMISDALVASFAFGYTARDGAIAYGPIEAPSGLASTPRIDLNGALDCASRVTLDRNAVDGMVNRWTVGSGDALDQRKQDSIEQYGERAYTVPSDTLQTDNEFAQSNFGTLIVAMADPLRAATVEVPILDWDQKTITAEPLDFATWNTRLYSIIGIRHEVSYAGGGWRATLNLDRNPWEIDGRTPP